MAVYFVQFLPVRILLLINPRKNMPKVIKSGVREVVLQIREFFTQEREFRGPIIPLEKVTERVAAATGVSLRTVTRIVREKKIADATCSKLGSQVKIRKIRKDKVKLDLGVLQRKIHEYYTVRNEIPTVKKLCQELKEEIGFTGSREIVRKHIKKIGYAPNPNTTGIAPNSNSQKSEIMEWLVSQNVEFSPDCNKQQLLEIMKKNIPEPVPLKLF